MTTSNDESRMERIKLEHEELFNDALYRNHDKWMARYLKSAVLSMALGSSGVTIGVLALLGEEEGTPIVLGTVGAFLLMFVVTFMITANRSKKVLAAYKEEARAYVEAIYNPTTATRINVKVPSVVRPKAKHNEIRGEFREALQAQGYDLTSDHYELGAIDRGADNPVLVVKLPEKIPNLYTLEWGYAEATLTPLTSLELEALTKKDTLPETE